MIQFDNERGGSGNYPFSNYQKFYLNLFSNVLKSTDPEFKKDVNDACYFNTSLMIDDEMKKSSKVRKFIEDNEMGAVYKLGRASMIEGYLQSVVSAKDTIKGKERKVVKITLFSPSENFRNPFGDLDSTNPNNGKKVGHIYEITSAYTTLAKRLINKLASLPEKGFNEKIKITIFQKFNDEGKKFKKDGTPDYDISVKIGGNSLMPRFVNPKQLENPSEELLARLSNDALNDNFIEICEEYTGEDFRIETDKFFRRFIENDLTHFVFAEYLVPKMQDMGFEVRIEGDKYKYTKIGGSDTPVVPQDDEDFEEHETNVKSNKNVLIDKNVEHPKEDDLPF